MFMTDTYRQHFRNGYYVRTDLPTQTLSQTGGHFDRKDGQMYRQENMHACKRTNRKEGVRVDRRTGIQARKQAGRQILTAFFPLRQDVVRMGICMPRGLKDFEIHSDYPVVIHQNNYTRVHSMAELDADTENNAIYHDTENG